MVLHGELTPDMLGIIFNMTSESNESLVYFDLSGNSLSGSISSDDWSVFKSMKYLLLANNNLTGQLDIFSLSGRGSSVSGDSGIVEDGSNLMVVEMANKKVHLMVLLLVVVLVILLVL